MAPPMGRAQHRLAVVGAGVAGCAAARAIAGAGLAVTLVDKGRVPGGRLSHKRLQTPAGPVTGAIGAQYATATSARFGAHLAALAQQGLAAQWCPQGLEPDRARFVGVPTMPALLGEMAPHAELRMQTRVAALARAGDGWRVATDRGPLGPFAAVLVTAPAPQAQALLQPVAPRLAEAAGAARLSPCWSALLWFEERLEPGFDAARPGHPAAAWVAREGARPGAAPCGDLWVVQAGPEWSAAHLEADGDAVATLMAEALAVVCGTRARPAARRAHRWRFALVAEPAGPDTLTDPERRLAAAGDWLCGPGIEAAFHAGEAAGRAMAGWFA